MRNILSLNLVAHVLKTFVPFVVIFFTQITLIFTDNNVASVLIIYPNGIKNLRFSS